MFYMLGGGGVPNYGDELISKAWLQEVAARHPQGRAFLECTNPSVSAVRLQDQNWRASHVSIIKDIAGRMAGDTFWANFERGYKFLHRNGFDKTSRFHGFDKLFEEIEVFHLLGGGYINNDWPRTGFLLGFAGSLKGRYGTKVVGTGLGLMPMERPPGEYRRMFRRVIEGFEFLETRDKAGADYLAATTGLEDIPISGLDDCFMVPATPIAGAPRTLHFSSFLIDERLADFANRLLAVKLEIERQFERVVFWNCAPNRDQQSAAKIREIFPESVEIDVWTLVDELPIGPDDFMITSRFHPHLLAARAGAQGYYIKGHSPYYRNKHKSVLDLGSPFRDFSEVESFGFAKQAPSKMVEQDASRFARKRALAERIYGQQTAGRLAVV